MKSAKMLQLLLRCCYDLKKFCWILMILEGKKMHMLLCICLRSTFDLVCRFVCSSTMDCVLHRIWRELTSVTSALCRASWWDSAFSPCRILTLQVLQVIINTINWALDLSLMLTRALYYFFSLLVGRVVSSSHLSLTWQTRGCILFKMALLMLLK